MISKDTTTCDSRLLPQCKWYLHSSGMLHHATTQKCEDLISM